MSEPLIDRVAARWLEKEGIEVPPLMKVASMKKTAGEVRFIKDNSGDKGAWAWGPPGPSQRTMYQEFTFNQKAQKPLATTLRAALMAMGHATRAQEVFVKIKSADISPDGSLGGKGYIQKITDMRKSFMNVVEALSAMTDTLYDELKAPHWHPEAAHGGSREREEVQEIMSDVKEIKKDPEGWAEKEEEEGVDSNEKEEE